MSAACSKAYLMTRSLAADGQERRLAVAGAPSMHLRHLESGNKSPLGGGQTRAVVLRVRFIHSGMGTDPSRNEMLRRPAGERQWQDFPVVRSRIPR
jgi:hypothetical protein